MTRIETWKIYQPNYHKVHKWIYRNFGRATHCSVDKTHTAKRFEWANISGDYQFDMDDWHQLCPSCHRKLDITPETREKISRSLTGRKIPSLYTPIIALTKSGSIKKFNSVREAAGTFNISRSAISNCLTGRAKTSGGYIWKYQE